MYQQRQPYLTGQELRKRKADDSYLFLVYCFCILTNNLKTPIICKAM